MPVALGLIALRGMLLQRRRPDRPILDELLRGPGFMFAGETDDAFAAVFLGTPWKPTGGPRPPKLGGVDDFAAFDEPGYVKAVMTFQAIRAPERCSRLVTETHVAPTDPGAERAFSRYWRVVQPGSGLVRRSWLAAAAKRAESDS